MSHKRVRPDWDSSDDSSEAPPPPPPRKRVATLDEEWDALDEALDAGLTATVAAWKRNAREVVKAKAVGLAHALATDRAFQAEASAAAARSERDSLQDELANERKRRTRLAGELAEMTKRLSSVEETLERVRTQVNDAYSDCEFAEVRARELQSELGAATTKLAFAEASARRLVRADALLAAAEKRADAAEKKLAARPATGVRTRGAAAAAAAAAASGSASSDSGSGRPLCTVCLTSAPELALRPCGHVCVCSDCYEEMDTGSSSSSVACPICRATVTSTLKVFVCTGSE